MEITICSSMKNKEEIGELIEVCQDNDITIHFPNLDFKIPESGFKKESMLKLKNDHFMKIQSSDSIYVLTPDKYIGRSVSIEIGYAKALGKKVIFSRRTEQLELDVLADNFLDIEGLLHMNEKESTNKKN